MRIADLLVDSSRLKRKSVSSPETDALTEEDALAEAALIDFRMTAITSDLWLLFDCRGALQLADGNAAVVVVKNVTRLVWEAEERGGAIWRAVMRWSPNVESAGLTIIVEAEPGGRLEVTGKGGEYFVGNVPGGDDPPPDFTTSTPAEIRAGMADWSSEFNVVGASVVEQRF